MDKIKVSIAGCSGYVGGELLRLLLFHPYVEVHQVTSERYAGKPVERVHPNLRKLRKLNSLTFIQLSELEACDLLFLSLPHGEAMERFDELKDKAHQLIDLSGDFRLKEPERYIQWYSRPHPYPDLLKDFVYGIPEIYREKMREAKYISSAGCNATATILPLYPLYKNSLVELDRTVVEIKAGTSQGGNVVSFASHHPERSGSIRSYKPSGHRHIAEMLQELSFGKDINIHFTATSINMVRGIHSVCHVFLKEEMDEKAIWKVYREAYNNEPFIRIIKDRKGVYRFPDPKILTGSNYCDIGFEKDPYSNRLIVFCAMDNLMKGAAGQAVQAFNIMNGFDEITGLEFPGLHPV